MKIERRTWVAGGVAVALGAIVLAGTSWAGRGFGPHGGMGLGMAPMVGDIIGSVDTNKDGALSQEEINGAITGRFGAADANADSQLTLEEFQAFWAELTRPVSVRAFQFLDPNGDANLARAELDERFGSVVQRFDRNGDGALSPADRPERGHGGWRGDDDAR